MYIIFWRTSPDSPVSSKSIASAMAAGQFFRDKQDELLGTKGSVWTERFDTRDCEGTT